MGIEMENIVYRDIHKNDYTSIISLINSTWDFKKFIKNPKTLQRVIRLLLMGTLLTSSYGKVAVKDGIVVGYILGRANRSRKRLLKFYRSFTMIKDFFALFFIEKQDKRNILEYLKVPKTYRELLKGKKFDAEIVFFAVDTHVRGLGIGKMLMKGLNAYFGEMSVKSIQVFTDTNSNYGFYDSQGYQLLGKKEITYNMAPAPEKLTVLLYGVSH
jgi:ribosomal protein S18 acetylase RimI-like enzyme